jgi:Ca2+-binding EF-hand superfamily protein
MTRSFISSLALAACLAAPAMAQQAAPAQPSPGQNFLSIWDQDGDGTVTLEELQSRRGEIFWSFDDDEDGTLSTEEFDALTAARLSGMQRPDGRGMRNPQGRRAMRFETMDADGDGSLTEDEYLGAAEAWLQAMDADSDGALTESEFGPGARRAAPGTGMARGAGQGQGGQSQGWGMDQAPGQMMGQGRGMGGQRQAGGYGCGHDGYGKGKGRMQHGMMYDDRSRMGPGAMDRHGRGEYGMGHAGMGQGGMRQGGGGPGGMGPGAMGPGGMAAPFQAFVTGDGALWVVDGRTGDVLLCTSGVNDGAPKCQQASN